MLNPDDISKIKKFCTEYPTIAAARIFGSTATGKNRRKSDIDIAIVVKHEIAAMERVEMETTLSNILQRDVDLVIFDQGSSLLQHQILKYGHLIYEADPKVRVQQEVSARRTYLDSAFLYRKINGEIDGRH